MPIVGGNGLSVGSAGRFQQPAGLSFTRQAGFAPGVIAPTGNPFPFIIRALFYVGGKIIQAVKYIDRIDDPVVKFLRFNTIPASLPKLTARTVVADTIGYTLQFLFGEEFEHWVTENVKTLAVQYTIEGQPSPLGTLVTVVFTPENTPMLDILKWDP